MDFSNTLLGLVAAARVAWLAKGLKQADLMLAAEREYERATDTSDKAGFLAAYHALIEFRTANAEYDQANFAGFGGTEKTREKANR